MKTSEQGIKLIERFEGCELTAYKDGAGVWTIGIGHIKGVHEGMTCTAEQAQAWLKEDLAEAEAAVTRLVTVPLNRNQFDACASFVYNLGQGSFGRSTLLKLLNAGQYALVPGQFRLWTLVAGKPSLGLTRRRAAESDLFQRAVTLEAA